MATCVVLILELRLVLLLVFSIVDRLRDVSVKQLAWDVGSIYIHRSVPAMLGGLICLGTRQGWSYDVILGMDWMSPHIIVLDFLRARVDIAGANESFYCMHATC